VEACGNENVGILPWSPLAGGWLTGKYLRDQPPTGATRLGEDPKRGMEAYAARNAQERTWHVIDTVRQVAEGRGASMSQVALAWVADRPAVSSVILGAHPGRRPDRVRLSVRCAGRRAALADAARCR
jgi:aryl-alcohol dehydrogenase-like predicted oxidoreductase